MRKISDVADGLRWSQPSALRNEFELRFGDDVVGTLKFRGLLGTLATAECGDGTWTFKRTGFWQSRASIRVAGSESDLATFVNNTWSSGGQLSFQNGRNFKAATNFWMTRFAFSDDQEQPLVRFHYGGVFHLSADVEIAAEARKYPELPVLVLFGWYLVVMLARDAGGAAAVAAAG